MTRSRRRFITALVMGAALFATDGLLANSDLPTFVRMWGSLAIALVVGALVVWRLKPGRRE